MPASALTSRELADNAHGDVVAGARLPQPAVALDPVAAVMTQHAGAQARRPPVGVVHSCVVLPDQGASCRKEGTEGVQGKGHMVEPKQVGRSRPVLEPTPPPTSPHAHQALVEGSSPTAGGLTLPTPHTWVPTFGAEVHA